MEKSFCEQFYGKTITPDNLSHILSFDILFDIEGYIKGMKVEGDFTIYGFFLNFLEETIEKGSVEFTEDNPETCSWNVWENGYQEFFRVFARLDGIDPDDKELIRSKDLHLMSNAINYTKDKLKEFSLNCNKLYCDYFQGTNRFTSEEKEKLFQTMLKISREFRDKYYKGFEPRFLH